MNLEPINLERRFFVVVNVLSSFILVKLLNKVSNQSMFYQMILVSSFKQLKISMITVQKEKLVING